MNTKQKIEIMQAYIDGKTILFRHSEEFTEDSWNIGGSNLWWDWINFDYKIKVEPVEGWVNVHKDGSCGYYRTEGDALKSRGTGCVRTVHLVEVKE